MTYLFRLIQRRRSLMIALLAAICLTLLLPAVASAHAVLLRSDPAQDALLSTPPSQVQMWFSEDLNPALSTAQVVNSARQRVDQNDAHVNANDSKEMDLSLQANLPPDVYVVVWRTDSADDGHVLLGSFLFTVTRADGSAPQLAAGNNPGQGILGNVNAGNSGTLDATGFFNLIVVTLVEIGAVFWVGAQIWLNFVLPTSSEKHPEEQGLNQRVEERFTRRFSLPALGVLLLANLGVLYGQALALSGGDWLSAFSPKLLIEEATSGRFGTYWLMRVIVILLAAGVGLFLLNG
ncbi:MAG: copper resistance CopC family protein, partial [Ktedonobacteraceae bacterium]